MGKGSEQGKTKGNGEKYPDINKLCPDQMYFKQLKKKKSSGHLGDQSI